MFKRKNKRRKKAKAFVLPMPFSVLAVLVATLALGYVCLKSCCEELGREIQSMECERAEMDKKLSIEEYRWTQMKSPRNLEESLAHHGIDMSWPRGDQVVRLSSPESAASVAMAGMSRAPASFGGTVER